MTEPTLKVEQKPTDSNKDKEKDLKDEGREKDPREQEIRDKAAELSPKEKEKGELLTKIGEIIKDYGGQESNVPLDNEYWVLLNRYRGLR